MNNSLHIPLIIFTIGTVALASCKTEDIAAPTYSRCAATYTAHPLHGTYSQLLSTYHTGTEAPGSIIGIKRAGQPAWVGAAGYSNLSHRSAMDACTPFRTASVTKMFTATVVMRLAEAGLFHLDDKVTVLLPELRGRIPQIDEITILHLLNHTSGLGHPTDDDRDYQLGLINNPGYFAGWNARKRLDRFVYGKPLKHSPGTRTYYSNAGYWLLEWLVEKATGKPFATNLNNLIIQPLHLENTYIAKQPNPDVARGYNKTGGLLKDVTVWDAADSDGDPASGIISTATDLLTFGEALFGGRLVNEESLNMMTSILPGPDCDNCGYGLGMEAWVTGPFSGYGMNGSSLGVDANLIYFPEQQTAIVVFSNYGGGNRKDVIEAFIRASA